MDGHAMYEHRSFSNRFCNFYKSITDRRTNRRTNGRTYPLIEVVVQTFSFFTQSLLHDHLPSPPFYLSPRHHALIYRLAFVSFLISPLYRSHACLTTAFLITASPPPFQLLSLLHLFNCCPSTFPTIAYPPLY